LLITIRKKEKVWGGKKNYGKGAGWRITKFEFVVKNGLQAKLIYHNDEVAKKKSEGVGRKDEVMSRRTAFDIHAFTLIINRDTGTSKM